MHLARRILIVLSACAVMLGLAQPASAQTAGNVVAFGDSFTAAPDDIAHWATRSSHNNPGSSQLLSADSYASYPRRGGCLQHPRNWPRQLAEITGREVIDWSCTAETSQSVLWKIDKAIAEGDLRGNTSAVILAVGGNDFGPFGISQGMEPLNRNSMHASFTNHMGQAAAKIRAVAPGAKIIVSGVPQVTNGTGLCLLNVIPNVQMGIPFPGYQVEGAIRDMQRAGAESNGMIFVDNYAMTQGHHTCAPEGERWVAGSIDTTVGDRTMALHPTEKGHAAIARHNAAVL